MKKSILVGLIFLMFAAPALGDPFGLDIVRGNVNATSAISKFGAAPDYDIADGFVTIWDGADDGHVDRMNYIYSTTADIDTISSSDAGDDQTIEVQGLDANFDLVTQTATLNGQTAVTLSTPLVRVFRMKNTGTTDNAGHVYCFVAVAVTGGVPNTLANIRAIIQVGNNQTLMAIYTIPNGKVGYFVSWYATTAGAINTSEHTIEIRARPEGGVFQLKHLSNLAYTGSSNVKHEHGIPAVFAEKTDIELRANTDTNVAGVAGGFEIILIDN